MLKVDINLQISYPPLTFESTNEFLRTFLWHHETYYRKVILLAHRMTIFMGGIATRNLTLMQGFAENKKKEARI